MSARLMPPHAPLNESCAVSPYFEVNDADISCMQLVHLLTSITSIQQKMLLFADASTNTAGFELLTRICLAPEAGACHPCITVGTTCGADTHV